MLSYNVVARGSQQVTRQRDRVIGIKAADGGFQVDVTGNANLKGCVIASSDKVVQKNQQSLTATTPIYSGIDNRASFDSSFIGPSFAGSVRFLLRAA
ncbi:MAG: hypothetical protein V4801_23830 [Burkholderia gladioli]